MTHSRLANRTAWTSDGSSRDGARVDRFIVHHAATTSLSAILALFQPGGRTVSANYALGSDGTLVATVEEQYRAWTTASYVDDRRAITIEVANLQAGGSWPVSAAAFDKLARLIADVAGRYGFDINDNTVLTHQEIYLRFGRSYATACPGDLQRRKGELINLARKYRGQGAAAPAQVSKPGNYWAGIRVQEIQKRLGVHGFPTDVDDIYGPDTTRQVRAFQKANGLTVDGDVGPKTWAKLKAAPGGKPAPQPAKASTSKAPAFPLPAGYYFGPKEGPAQSVSGYYSHRADLRRWQQRMIDRGWIFEHGADGLYGPETAENARAFQREKGLAVDGLIGPQTWRAAWEAPVT